MSDHIDEEKLVELHESGKRKSCFWKHPYGQSKKTELLISASEYDSHPCHYLMNSYKAAKKRKDIHNTRHKKTNREKAVEKGYLKQNTDGTVRGNTRTNYYSKAIKKVASDKQERSFRDRYQAKYVKSLLWLELDEQGWNVGYRIPVEQAARHMRGIWRRKQKKVRGKKTMVYKLVDEGYAPEAMAIARKKGQGPANFAIVKSQAEPGLGSWYPYDHEHHHLISCDAIDQQIMEAESSDGWNYMQRAAVMMQAGWNIHNKHNLILLPSETYAAHVLDLPAHCPWEAPDHPPYTLRLSKWLKDVQEAIDQALSQTRNDPEHKITRTAAQKIRRLLRDASENAMELLLSQGARLTLGM